MQWNSDDASPEHSPSATKRTPKKSKTNSRSSSTVDNSLTSLNWLPVFKIPSLADGNSRTATDQHGDGVTEVIGLAKSNTCIVSNSDSSSSTGSVTQESEAERDECFLPLSPIKRCLNQTAEFDKDPLRFEENPSKPPFSYTTIIYLAIRSCNKEKVMLSDIYQWIKDHFKYYRIAESTWQNSVRHNLSLNHFFRKIPRGEGDPGKGSFWQINPEYEHLLNNDQELQRLVEQQNGIKPTAQRKRSTKGRRKSSSTLSSNSNSNSFIKQTKKYTKGKRSQNTSSPDSATANIVDPCHIPGDLDWVSLLSSQKVAGCVSCGTSGSDTHQCRPSFGSPILSDLTTFHTLGDPSVAAVTPSVLPVTSHKIADETTPSQKNILCSSLEEIITTQESPAPLLPPWAAETRPFSPTGQFSGSEMHPWAETTTDHHETVITAAARRGGHWSPTEVMWSNPQMNPSNKLQIAQLI